MVEKEKIIQQICQELEREITTLSEAAKEAKDAATHEDSKAENKYDTRGLEASYLAAGQSRRVEEIRRTLSLLQTSKPINYSEDSKLGVFALIQAEIENKESRLYFLVPKQGGHTFKIDDNTITTLSIESPLGSAFTGKCQGDSFEFCSTGRLREYEITLVW